ncbi:MAG: hypothetical protein ACSHYF_02665 [Verrucomicrobiaceae bacterium]
MILREKILLGLVGVSAIGAVIVYAPALLSPPAAASTRTPIDFPALVAKVQQNLKEGESTNREKRVLAAATTEWVRNPLRDRPLVLEEQKDLSAPLAEFVVPLPEYVGYLNIGGKVIAIIDGQDYRAGEMIEGGEFQVSQIHSDHIELLRRGATDPVNVPLEKPQLTGKQQSKGETQ